MDIASPWDQRVYEKEGEKIEKYQDLKREIGRLWGISINLLIVYRESVNLIGYITRRLSADSQQL